MSYGQIMKPHRVLEKYFEVYGQADQLTPEAWKKRLLFLEDVMTTK